MEFITEKTEVMENRFVSECLEILENCKARNSGKPRNNKIEKHWVELEIETLKRLKMLVSNDEYYTSLAIIRDGLPK